MANSTSSNTYAASSSLAQFQCRICPPFAVVFAKTALEMLQNLELTLCTIFFLLIKQHFFRIIKNINS